MLTFSNTPRQNNKCKIVGPMIIPIFNITKENPTKSKDKHVFFTLFYVSVIFFISCVFSHLIGILRRLFSNKD
jgi:hypothetical protein